MNAPFVKVLSVTSWSSRNAAVVFSIGTAVEAPGVRQLTLPLAIFCDARPGRRAFDIALDSNDRYEVLFLRGRGIVGRLELGPVPEHRRKPGMTSYNMDVPPAALADGFDTIIVSPMDGDDRFAIGHLLLDGEAATQAELDRRRDVRERLGDLVEVDVLRRQPAALGRGFDRLGRRGGVPLGRLGRASVADDAREGREVVLLHRRFAGAIVNSKPSKGRKLASAALRKAAAAFDPLFMDRATAALEKAAKGRAYLSDERVLAERVERLQGAVMGLRRSLAV